MQKIFSLIALAISTVLLLSACSPAAGGVAAPSPTDSGDASSGVSAAPIEAEDASADAYKKITAEEAKKWMDEGGVTVVDVRRADEYAQKHIPGAVLVPVESIGDAQPEALPDLEAVLLVHCRTGVRSKQASERLLELGYTNVYDFGGIVDWPYETESGEEQ